MIDSAPCLQSFLIHVGEVSELQGVLPEGRSGMPCGDAWSGPCPSHRNYRSQTHYILARCNAWKAVSVSSLSGGAFAGRKHGDEAGASDYASLAPGKREPCLRPGAAAYVT